MMAFRASGLTQANLFASTAAVPLNVGPLCIGCVLPTFYQLSAWSVTIRPENPVPLAGTLVSRHSAATPNGSVETDESAPPLDRSDYAESAVWTAQT